MSVTLDDRLAEGLASLEEQLSNLEREAGVSPSARPASMKWFPITQAMLEVDWRYVALVGSLLAASIGVAGLSWSSSVDPAMKTPPDPALLTRGAPDAVAPAAVALRSESSQQLQPMARDLAALSQTVEQLKARQEQLIRDNDDLASQLKASRDEATSNKSIIDQINANQIQMARESATLTERLNASQEQLDRVIAKASEPKASEPKASEPKALEPKPSEREAMSEAPPKVSPEEPKVMPNIPLPRPRQAANVAQMQKPARTPERSQAKKPQSVLAWPWSSR
ncbi:hypothetical protein GCM10007857_30310 [Bradyrhizobium iriomotense]|uniref:Uncharacterized protein n=2 Tax=Bradyrhizobium iriomotense TaxID=441950 RepID=A0ABQ6B0A0_9BRAD|nr:hypothetical protein GCM10007857_30310 [Bradyrhizobium iriomotense]